MTPSSPSLPPLLHHPQHGATSFAFVVIIIIFGVSPVGAAPVRTPEQAHFKWVRFCVSAVAADDGLAKCGCVHYFTFHILFHLNLIHFISFHFISSHLALSLLILFRFYNINEAFQACNVQADNGT